MKSTRCSPSWVRNSDNGILISTLSDDVTAGYDEKTGQCWLEIDGKFFEFFQFTRSQWLQLTKDLASVFHHLQAVLKDSK